MVINDGKFSHDSQFQATNVTKNLTALSQERIQASSNILLLLNYSDEEENVTIKWVRGRTAERENLG